MTATVEILQSAMLGIGDMLLCIGALVFMWLVAAEDGL